MTNEMAERAEPAAKRENTGRDRTRESDRLDATYGRSPIRALRSFLLARLFVDLDRFFENSHDQCVQ
jgi:hypothetical protein